MIEKLRRKFILYAMLSVFALLSLILGSINAANFLMVANDADQVTQLIADNDGSFGENPPPEEDNNPGNHERPGTLGPGSKETPESTRFFTFSFDRQGNINAVDFRISAVSMEQAKSWASDIYSSNKAGAIGWTETYYRFRVYAKNSLTYVTVIDETRELSPSYRILWASLIGSGGGLLASFLLLLPISKRLVKPLEESNRKQKRFISDASHELKTPLTVISANAEILEMEKGASEETEVIQKQVGKLTAMVKNLNSLAKLDELDDSLAMGAFDFSAAATEISESFKAGFQRKGKTLRVEISPDLTYQGDEKLIRQLFGIILDNALKYALKEASFKVVGASNRISILAENDAEGLEDGSLDRIFERFYRSDSARASEVEGSGIGLSIAKQIVDKHHGRISAKAENGRFILKAEF